MAKFNVKMYKCVKLTVHIYTTDCKASKIKKKKQKCEQWNLYSTKCTRTNKLNRLWPINTTNGFIHDC